MLLPINSVPFEGYITVRQMLLLTFLVYVTLLAGGTLGDLDTQWRTFKTTYKKQYGGEESLR